MRILHLSWEYPPLVYGGLGRHVHALAEEQARQGHDVVVVTQTEGAAETIEVNGVRVIRSPRDVPDLPLDNDHLLAWVASMEHALTRAVIELAADWQPDVIHAHDWVVAHVAAAAEAILDRPVVATFHATEAGRHQGWVPEGLPRAVHSVERWLAALATRVIACSEHMKWETGRLFDIEATRADVIPNGIHPEAWRPDPAAVTAARQKYTEQGPLVVFTGRLEWEKGVQVLLDAIPAVRRANPKVQFVIAGKGGQAESLRKQSRRLRLSKRVTFVGWLPEDELHALVAAADVAVVPSLYDPFGLVALEAAALGTPLLLSDTGGLGEIADEGRIAATFTRDDADSLSIALIRVLAEREATMRRTALASQALSDQYNWEKVARQTLRTYEQAEADWDSTGSRPTPVRPSAPPTGNLLEVSETAEDQSGGS